MPYQRQLKSFLLVLFFSSPIQAEEVEKRTAGEGEIIENAALAPQEVNIRVVGNVKAHQRPNKVQKSIDLINKEQVSNIRDLTRYDPGISVVEQGQGATKGYSIYGVDRNRVAINVDGLAQAESFQLHRQSTSGARLESEYEHVSQVDINKGADSVNSGSGALGGAVSLRTKSAKDIIETGKTRGVRYKTGYFSKDQQWLNSFAVAADNDRFDALLMHTRRTGHEYQANVKNAPGQTFSYRKLKPNLNDPYRVEIGGTDVEDGTIHLSAQDIVGETRLLPDPMKMQSEATLFKSGLKLGEQKEHYLGIVGELEKKRFDIHVKSESEFCERKGTAVFCKNKNSGSERIQESMASHQFRNEAHRRQRVGLEYLYRPQDTENSWVDRVKLAINWQFFRVDLDESIRRCTKAPFADSDCRPKFWDEKLAEDGFGFKQRQNNVSLELDKWLETPLGEHDIKLNLGMGKNNYTVNTRSRYYSIDYLYPGKRLGPQHKNCITVKNKAGMNIPVCEWHTIDLNEDSRPIDQKKWYLSLSDQVTFNRWLSADVGIRWEVNRFHSEQNGLPLDNYRNSAYRAGLNIQASEHLTFGYKYATGFRIPSAGEMYGSFSEIRYRNNPAPETQDFIDKNTKLKPEISEMHELSARLNTSWLNGSLTVFTVNYDNLIGRGQLWRIPRPSHGSKSYFERNYNLQETKVKGGNLTLQSELYNIWDKIPNGLSATFSATIVKPIRSKVINPDAYSDYMTYPLEALQPLKIVYGFDYNAPNGKWGISHRVTYSQGKSEKELLTHGKLFGNTIINDQAVGRYLNKKWSTVDILGYWKPYKNFTINAGIYNVFNYQYTTWESARRTVTSSDSPSKGKVLLAPGRSFSLSAEFTF
ncbi:TonB-dependent hemoglobin/transferrin/lactoferrin family receptor [Testudinibacter sp. P27/CKL/0425]